MIPLRKPFSTAGMYCLGLRPPVMRSDFHVHAKLSAHPLIVDLQVQFPHSGNQCFARLRVVGDLEGGVLAAETPQGLTQLIGPVPGRRSD